MRSNSLRGPMWIGLVWLVGVIIGSGAAVPALADASSGGPLTDGEKRGRQIFLRGTSASGRKIAALFGDERTEVPASSLPCVNCHGHDGLGRPEGGVTPSNITWDALTKPYEVDRPGGRVHPPYTDRAFVSAVSQSLDPAGNALNTTMPRYLLTREEARDLLAYVKRLDDYRDPGLRDDRIRIGSVLPAGGKLGEVGEAIETVMKACVRDLNEAGGIFNREIELRVVRSDSKGTAAEVKRLIEEEQVFALAGAFVEGAEEEVDRLLGDEEIPLVGAVTASPPIRFPLNRYVFYLLSGVKEQARAMVDFAAGTFGKEGPRAAILAAAAGGETESESGVAAAVEAQCKTAGWSSASVRRYDPEKFEAARLVAELKAAGVQAVFLLGSGAEQGAVLREAARLGWNPSVFVPGPLAGSEVLDCPPGFKGRIFLSFPRGPADKTAAGLAEYRAFAEKHRLPRRQLSVQIGTYCAMKTLAEGLKRAGRDLSREKLVTTLEGLYEFETGLMPKITFGPNRRIGALGAYVAAVQPEARRVVPVSEWIKLR